MVVKEKPQLTLSSLRNSRSDNVGLNCSIMLIPNANLGLEITLHNLSIYGVREFCAERCLSFSSVFQRRPHNGVVLKNDDEDAILQSGQGENEFSPRKFCGKLEDYSKEELVLTFMPSSKPSIHENSEKIYDDVEYGENGDFDDGDTSNNHVTRMSVMLKVNLPSALKTREAFLLDIKPISPCQKIFLTELNGTLTYTTALEQNIDSNYEDECSIFIHVPYGYSILTEISVSSESNHHDESVLPNNSSSLQLSPFNSVSLNSLLIDSLSSFEIEEHLADDCSSFEQHVESQLLVVNILDLINDKNKSFCFSFSKLDTQESTENSRIWNSVGNQIRIIFTLRYFQEIKISYKSLRIIEISGECDEGWVRFGNACVLLIEKPATWLNAEKDCQKKGGHLLTIRNGQTSKEIEPLILSR